MFSIMDAQKVVRMMWIVLDLVLASRQMKVAKLVNITGISTEHIYHIFGINMTMEKFYSRFVSCLLIFAKICYYE